MTKPRYSKSCVAGSKDRGVASSSPVAGNPDYAWNVNFNNGNSNWNNRNNNGFVRAVRGPVLAGECQGVAEASFKELYQAMCAARSGKKPSANQLTFVSNWMERLLDLERRLQAGSWSPSPSTCFIANQPKAREIHAPDFADRVVHHWLVPHLEALYERTFIEHSYSNRKGKGTHAAVDQLRSFVREVQSGQDGGWYLQLDIANFFNSIHRPTLWRILKQKLERGNAPSVIQRATHALLRYAPGHSGVNYRASAQERANVPPHKRLENAAPGCGLPIGNLSSQFFANVYLNALDQFVKHTLKAQRYVRYVDDFVIVHRSREQLEQWRGRIESFLSAELRLDLKADQRLQPLTSGVDFLGYVIFPDHTRVRSRVVSHANQALTAWSSAHLVGSRLRVTAADLERGRSIWMSYAGHLSHANAYRLSQSLISRYPFVRVLQASRKTPSQLRHRPFTIEVHV